MSSLYKWDPSVEAVEMDGEWVIMHAENYTVTKLNEVGGRIWSLLRENHSIETLSQAIYDEYEVTMEQATTDVSRFLAEMERIGVVTCAS